MSTDNEPIIIKDAGEIKEEVPPVQLYNERPQQQIVDPDWFLISITISVSDFISKVEAFGNVYKDTMIYIRQNDKEKWKTLLDKLKERYTQGNVVLDVAVELVAALAIEYEIALQENGVGTEFSKALYEFKNNK